MHIRCPHCRNPIEVVEDQELCDVVCPGCGSTFNLLPDETTSRTAAARRTLGHFELLQRIGVGAFGEVWTAHDSELDRIVAIKLPRKGQLSAEEAESFLREARSAARLSHPGIVAVHEVGKADDQLFIVSDYVQGVTLADWLTGKRPTAKEAAELVVQLAEGVQHAHEHGVIHRDLKPSNIILDERGQPHIMDFGLAKREAGEITMTNDGKVLGTPAYMPPEQAKGASHDADARSDVYSLGVVLFELLTSELPFRGNTRMLVHQVINEEPPGPRTLSNQVPMDLDTICLKCLEKDPDKRYQTARALADDLVRFIDGKPIEARPATALSKAWRFCKRKPLVSALSAATLGLLLTAAIIAIVSAYREARLRQEAQTQVARNRRLLYVADMGQAQQAWERGDLERLKSLLRRHVPEGRESEFRSFEWYYLWRLWKRDSDTNRIELPDTRKYTANNLAMPKKGSRVAVINPAYVGDDPAVTVVDIARKTMESFGVVKETAIWPPFLAISEDGERVAFPCDKKNRVVFRDLPTGKERQIEVNAPVTVVRFFPDGQSLAIGCADRSIIFWDLKSWAPAGTLKVTYAAAVSLAFSPDGALLIAEGDHASVEVWRVTTGELVWTEESHARRGIGLAISPDGKYVVSGTDSMVVVRDMETGKIRHVLAGARDEVRSVSFSGDGRLLAAGSRDGQIRVWSLPDFTEFAVISGYNSMYALGFLPEPDGRLVFGGYEGCLVIREVRLDDYEDVLPAPRFKLPTNAALALPRSLAFSADSRVLVAIGAAEDYCIRRWRLTATGVDDLEPIPLEFAAGPLAATKKAVLAVSERASATIHLFDLQSGEQINLLADSRALSTECIEFSPTGNRLAVGYGDGTLIVWDVRSRQVVMDKVVHKDCINCLAFVGDDTSLMTGSRDHFAALWNVDGSRIIHDFGRQGDEVTAMAAAPDGSVLAVGCFAGSPLINLWNGRTFTKIETLRGHTLTVWGLAFFRDARTLASASGDRTIRFWDLSNCEERFMIEEKSIGFSLAMSPDEKTLAVWFSDGTIRLYRAASIEEVGADPVWGR